MRSLMRPDFSYILGWDAGCYRRESADLSLLYHDGTVSRTRTLYPEDGEKDFLKRVMTTARTMVCRSRAKPRPEAHIFIKCNLPLRRDREQCLEDQIKYG